MPVVPRRGGEGANLLGGAAADVAVLVAGAAEAVVDVTPAHSLWGWGRSGSRQAGAEVCVSLCRAEVAK